MSIHMLALTNVTNAPILLGTKTMRPAPAGEKASIHPIYAPLKVLRKIQSQSRVVSFPPVYLKLHRLHTNL
jgi:hypothetical protein